MSILLENQGRQKPLLEESQKLGFEVAPQPNGTFVYSLPGALFFQLFSWK